MEVELKCKKCKETERYDKSDVQFIGSFSEQISFVKCIHCGQRIELDRITNEFPKNKDLILKVDKEGDGIIIGDRTKIFRDKNKGDAYERVVREDILEYWAQQFFKEHFGDYKFKNVKGPFDVGPDFTTSNGVGIEIERGWKNYIAHKHHLDERFLNVKYLVVLSPHSPPEAKRQLLPPEIIHLDVNKFVPWYRLKAMEYSETKKEEQEEQKLSLILELIKGQFYARYLEICPDKDRDMANCPDCESCAYTPEYDFLNLALEFTIHFDYPIWEKGFSLGDIKTNDLDEFFESKIDDTF